MTTREPLLIGPFVGGLNTFDDQSSIKDTECYQALNFDMGTDGSLRSRPPFTDTGNSIIKRNDDAYTHGFLGFYYDANGKPYLIAASGWASPSTGGTSVYDYETKTWTTITNTFSAADMVQFDGKAWLVAPNGSANPGGYWTPSGGFVADSNMPKGESITAYKARLFIASGQSGTSPTRMYYSKVLGQSSFWASAAFLEVGSGDGQAIVKLVTYFDSILVFRSESIWEYQYNTDPATAISSIMVPGIGLVNRFSLAIYESYIYFMYDEGVYELANSKANKLNDKVLFESVARESDRPYEVSIFNDRLVCHFFEKLYIFSLRTRTWTMWRSDVWGPVGRIVTPNSDTPFTEGLCLQNLPSTYGGSDRYKVLHIQEGLSDVAESFQCILQTKIYSFSVPGAFKVLFWWGIDAVFRGHVRGYATPVSYSQAVTWGQLLSQGLTWGDLGTWSHPALPDPSVITDVTSTGSGNVRKFVRFLKKLRFRQISFKVAFDVDGTSETAPVELFTISAYMNKKQTVNKQIS